MYLRQQFRGQEFSRFISTRLLVPLRSGGSTMEAAGMIGRDANVSLASGEAERVPCVTVTHNLFQVLAVRPTMGRLFVPADDAGGAARVAVASYSYWQTRLGGRTAAIGWRDSSALP